jgi:hypothetical protein
LIHAGIREEQRRIGLRDELRAGHIVVPPLSEIPDKGVSKLLCRLIHKAPEWIDRSSDLGIW